MDFLFCIFYVEVGKQVGNLSVARLSHIFQSLPSVVVVVVVVVGQRTKTMSRKTLKCITKLKCGHLRMVPKASEFLKITQQNELYS